MSQFSPIVLTDGVSADVTLNPDGKNGNAFDYREAGKAPIEAMSLRQIQSATNAHRKVYTRLKQPQTAIDTDTSAVVLTGQPLIVTVECQIPVEVSEADRILFIDRAFSQAKAGALRDALALGQNTW